MQYIASGCFAFGPARFRSLTFHCIWLHYTILHTCTLSYTFSTFVCLAAWLPACLSVCLSICLSVYTHYTIMDIPTSTNQCSAVLNLFPPATDKPQNRTRPVFVGWKKDATHSYSPHQHLNWVKYSRYDDWFCRVHHCRNLEVGFCNSITS